MPTDSSLHRKISSGLHVLRCRNVFEMTRTELKLNFIRTTCPLIHVIPITATSCFVPKNLQTKKMTVCCVVYLLDESIVNTVKNDSSQQTAGGFNKVMLGDLDLSAPVADQCLPFQKCWEWTCHIGNHPSTVHVNVGLEKKKNTFNQINIIIQCLLPSPFCRIA